MFIRPVFFSYPPDEDIHFFMTLCRLSAAGPFHFIIRVEYNFMQGNMYE